MYSLIREGAESPHVPPLPASRRSQRRSTFFLTLVPETIATRIEFGQHRGALRESSRECFTAVGADLAIDERQLLEAFVHLTGAGAGVCGSTYGPIVKSLPPTRCSSTPSFLGGRSGREDAAAGALPGWLAEWTTTPTSV